MPNSLKLIRLSKNSFAGRYLFAQRAVKLIKLKPHVPKPRKYDTLRGMEKRFKRIYLEITNLCNLSCSFCPIDQRKANTMALPSFKAIIDQAEPLAEQICLHLMGEPLAHPEIENVLKYCSQIGAKIQITTNGLLLGKHRSLIMAEPCVSQVNVSLQSYMDNFPAAKVENYLEKVFQFIDYAQSYRPDMYINLRLWNLEDKAESEQNNKVFDFIDKRLGIKINRNVEVGRIKSKKIQGRLYLHFDSRFEWPRMDLPIQGDQGRCNGLKDHIAIHSDGTVVPCCLDDQKILNLGNCLETELTQILENERAQAMLKGFQNGALKEELCKRCSYINRFKK